MAQDPFAAYVVQDADPFAQFAAQAPKPQKPDISSIKDMASAKAFLDAGGEMPVNDTPLMPASLISGGGRLLTAALGGAKRALPALPIIGKPMREFAKGAGEAWKASQPAQSALKAAPVAATATAKAAGLKTKLRAPEVAALLRKEYGSAQAGRMLYGPARPGLKAAERQAAIKRLTPEIKTTLPEGAKKAINKELAASTNDEAFAYAAKAPNAPAQSYIGEQLRAALLAKMQGR